MEMTTNPRPEQFPPHARSYRESRPTLRDYAPALKIEGIEANSEQLYITAAPAQDALAALLSRTLRQPASTLGTCPSRRQAPPGTARQEIEPVTVSPTRPKNRYWLRTSLFCWITSTPTCLQ